MKTIYTLENIHDFLLEQGCPEWEYEVYDRMSGQKREAKIEDFTKNIFHRPNMSFINRRGDECNLEVFVNNFKFITFRDKIDVMGSGSETYIDKDFTGDWIGYLSQTYGQEYAEPLLQYAINNKHRIEQETEEKIENFRLKVQAEAKGPYMYFNDLEENAKAMLPSDKIEKIEEENAKSLANVEDDILGR